jgi:GMP synthase-like glutamine amidotransferase
MRVACLLHAEHEDTGCIAPWLLARGHDVHEVRLHAGEPLPALDAFDWLMVMGGPMNIYEHAAYPWLVPEKKLIADAVAAGRRVLGVCLGSQLLADALGGEVTRNAETEIGWFEVRGNGALKTSTAFAGFPETFEAFHWHGDTFAIPPGARLLLGSDACAHQAFDRGPRVAGIQFHLELTAANAREWLEVEAPPPQRTVQDARTILSSVERFAANNRLMARLLENLETG